MPPVQEADQLVDVEEVTYDLVKKGSEARIVYSRKLRLDKRVMNRLKEGARGLGFNLRFSGFGTIKCKPFSRDIRSKRIFEAKLKEFLGTYGHHLVMEPATS